MVFQHLPDPAITYGYVTEMGRVLRPGGWAAFQVSDDPSDPPPPRLRGRRGRRRSAIPAWLGSAVDLDDPAGHRRRRRPRRRAHGQRGDAVLPGRVAQALARARYRRLVAADGDDPAAGRVQGRSTPTAVVAEIGANDGHSHDPLHPIPPGWTGVLVEPQPAVFARLRHTVGDHPGLRLVNAAVTGTQGTVPFFAPASDDTLGSLYPQPGAERIEVDAVTFDGLGLERLDLLVVDTEGHDWEILRHAPLERLRPRLIVYEHFHLQPARPRRRPRPSARRSDTTCSKRGWTRSRSAPEPADEDLTTAVAGGFDRPCLRCHATSLPRRS